MRLEWISSIPSIIITCESGNTYFHGLFSYFSLMLVKCVTCILWLDSVVLFSGHLITVCIFKHTFFSEQQKVKFLQAYFDFFLLYTLYSLKYLYLLNSHWIKFILSFFLIRRYTLRYILTIKFHFIIFNTILWL